jgi:hypothetical protein
MSVTKEKIEEITKGFGKNENDFGSTEAQTQSLLLFLLFFLLLLTYNSLCV